MFWENMELYLPTVFTLLIVRTINNFKYEIFTIFVTTIRGCTNIREYTIIEI